MNEYNLTRRLVEMVEEEAVRSEAVAVAEVTVRIGTFSSAEPPLLQEAFKRCRHGTCSDAALVIHHCVEHV